MVRCCALAGLLISATANASVWDHALSSPEDDAAHELFDAKMLEGDTATLSAMAQAASLKNILDSVARAAAAYRAAAALRPRDPEPYFRIGNLLYQIHFSCDSQSRLPTCDAVYATPRRMEMIIDAWDEFERRAPLDPRVSDIVLKRPLLHTHLVTGGADDRKHLEAAARDYEVALDRSDGFALVHDDEQLLGNLAETYMMLDRLDDAIATYSRAIAMGAAHVSTIYGLAVALDRDGSGERALQCIRDQTANGFDAFQQSFTHQQLFYVPAGEVNYYYALANEAFGEYGEALEYWNRYIASGAHPEFQPRAREHIEQLRKRHVRREAAPEPDEANW